MASKTVKTMAASASLPASENPVPALTVGHGMVAISTAWNRTRESVGLYGAAGISYVVIFWNFGTREQKAEFTDKVLLLHGIPTTWAGWVALGVGLLAILALWRQQRHHTSIETALRGEVASLGNQLAELREKLSSNGEMQKLPYMEET